MACKNYPYFRHQPQRGVPGRAGKRATQLSSGVMCSKTQKQREYMNNSLKGACLSGLVYPGLGQIVQRHYMRGIVLIGIVSACLMVILLNASRNINTILVNIESSNSDLDIATILKEVNTFSAGQDYQIVKVSSSLIFCCWAIGIVDAYLAGKRVDSRTKAHNKSL